MRRRGVGCTVSACSHPWPQECCDLFSSVSILCHSGMYFESLIPFIILLSREQEGSWGLLASQSSQIVSPNSLRDPV